jgi:guanylate kinase
VQQQVEGSVTLFIAADVPELERRLRARATESSGEIGERIVLARHQLEQAYRFRYMVRNDDVERATDALAVLVERELQFTATMSRP